MEEMKHSLIDEGSEKVFNLLLRDNTLILETGKLDKLKITEKEFSSNEEALKSFYKKEWEALKKGFILNNENARVGQPILHKFIGGAYTGALSFTSSPYGVFVCKDEPTTKTKAQIAGSLNLIDYFGRILKTIDLPEPLVWGIEYRARTNSLLMDINHNTYMLDLEKECFTNFRGNQYSCTSFISVSHNKIAFAKSDKISVIDDENKILFTRNYDYEVIQGVIPFCGKLSQDGALLAFHNKVGQIEIIDAKTGNLLNKIIGDFGIVGQLEFAENNTLLVIREEYATTWGMRYFDLTSNKEISIKELEIPAYSKDVNIFCFNNDQTKLVLLQRANVYVFDFINKKLLHSFKIEHFVKKCKVEFIEENLGVRTDYGCFSIYKI